MLEVISELCNDSFYDINGATTGICSLFILTEAGVTMVSVGTYVLCLACLGLVSAQVFGPGGCPDAQAQSSFDLNRVFLTYYHFVHCSFIKES